MYIKKNDVDIIFELNFFFVPRKPVIYFSKYSCTYTNIPASMTNNIIKICVSLR